jgi:hypothetical protein
LREALKCRSTFQRAAATSFFVAVKIHEPSVLGIRLMVNLCRGLYEESDIVAKEIEILSALEWRVCVSSTMPMEYVRHFVDLLPLVHVDVANLILEEATMLADIAPLHVYFSTCGASSVRMA